LSVCILLVHVGWRRHLVVVELVKVETRNQEWEALRPTEVAECTARMEIH
jgi:hypothetical protein